MYEERDIERWRRENRGERQGMERGVESAREGGREPPCIICH